MALLLGGAPIAYSQITAVWANDGGDKVTQDELRATNGTENLTGHVRNRVWNGSTIALFGAHNEEISFNLVLEAGASRAHSVTVTFDTLTGPGGATIHSMPASGDRVFDWTNRPIELFYARYLQITGLSYFGYDQWDERQLPARFRRPADSQGHVPFYLGWSARPDHDKWYPDPLVPLEIVGAFDVQAANNQSIWCDIYIPRTAPAGIYTGNVIVLESGIITYTIPVQLAVQPFTLTDSVPRAFGHFSGVDIINRYVGPYYVNWASPQGRFAQAVTDRYFELFHRHGLALIGENECPIADQPCDSSVPRLNGSLYQASSGYDGRGVGLPNGIFSIGDYGTWNWQFQGESSMWQHADNWATWFKANLPTTDYFLYTEDEPSHQDQYATVDQWARWINEDPGPGHDLTSASTVWPVLAQQYMPNLDIPIMPAGIGICPSNQANCDNYSVMNSVANAYRNVGKHKLWAYNDSRPATGSSMTEDDGVAMRSLGWAQYKKLIDKWFYWFVDPVDLADLFASATTFGYRDHFDISQGEIGPAASNGDGLLVYPGTDVNNPNNSYGVSGPIASLRLKEWRRGLQDEDYLTLASYIDPVATAVVLNRVMPQALWDYQTNDPSYYTGGGVSWSSDPDVWEQGRYDLAQIISIYCTSAAGALDSVCTGAAPATPASVPVLTTQLMFASSTGGAQVVVSGAACQPGTYSVPVSLSLASGTLCTVQALAPPGFAFGSWIDISSTDNPRAITVPSRPLTLGLTFQQVPAPAPNPAPTPSPTPLPSPAPGATPAAVGYRYVPIIPCRLVDTRSSSSSAFQSGEIREYIVPASSCGIPSAAQAYALNATAIPVQTLRWLSVWPSDQAQPFVSTLNSFDGRTKASSVIVRAGADHGVKVYATDPTHVILDVNGYFEPEGALTYFPVAPCRVVDTRRASSALGQPWIPGKTERSFPILQSGCGLPSSAQAYALNYTVIPRAASFGYLTAWPTGAARPLASNLNATTGSVTANSSITQAGQGGAISVYGSDNFDVVIDVVGYFDTSDKGGLLYYPLDSCRLLDTREENHPLNGSMKVIAAGSCGVPAAAQVVTGNATAVPLTSLPWMTLWPDGAPQPQVSTLNAYDGMVTSNFTFVPLQTGAFDVFAKDVTFFVFDVYGYFAP